MSKTTPGDWALYDVAPTGDGKVVVTCDSDGGVMVRDLASGKIVRRTAGHHGLVDAVDLTSDGEDRDQFR